MADISKINLDNTLYNIKDTEARNSLANKQDTLVSGTNIKSINNQSLLGGGNITIEGTEPNINTISVNGTEVQPDSSKNVDLTIPTKTSDLTNDGEDGTSTYVSFSDVATDSDYGLVKLNSSESITLNSNGQLNVGGRLGQFPTTTGVYSPKSINPNTVGNGSFLLTEASGTKLGNKSLAVSTGTGINLKTTAAAGATQYIVSNTYANRIICAGAVGGTIALNEATAAEKYVNVTSVQINGSNYVPDSSANSSTDNIVITSGSGTYGDPYLIG